MSRRETYLGSSPIIIVVVMNTYNDTTNDYIDTYTTIYIYIYT